MYGRMNGNEWNRIKEELRCRSNERIMRINNGRAEKRRNNKRPMPRPHETEEEAITRRFHDAQRMARFRAKKKKALEEAKAIEAAKLMELSLISELRRRNISFHIANPGVPVDDQENFDTPLPVTNSSIIMESTERSKYSQLLAIVEEIGRNIKLSYAGSKSSAERLKVGIVQARMLVKDCLIETEVNSRH